MHRLSSKLPAVLAASLAALLGGCGGGYTPPPAYDALATYKAFLSAPRTLTLNGTASNGAALTLTWTVTPVGAAVFPLTNAAGQRIDSSIVIRNGATVLASGSQQAYLGSDFSGLGSVRSNGSCSQSGTGALPTAAPLGQSGSLGTSTIYQTCSLSAAKEGTIDGTWSIEEIKQLIYVCSNTRLNNNAGALVSTESDCIEIAPGGGFGSRAMITTNVSGTQVSFSN